MIGYLAIVLAVAGIIAGVASSIRALLVDKRQKLMAEEFRALVQSRGYRDVPLSAWLDLMSSREFHQLRAVWPHLYGAATLRDVGHLVEARPGKKALPVRKKKAIQKMGPKTFYYLDVTHVKDLYSQAFQELEPKRIETQESQESQKGIKADLKLIQPRYETGRGIQTKKTYEPEQTPAVMYNNVEEYLIAKAEVTFGIEDFEYDESPVNEFRSMCSQMKSKFDFNVPEELQAKFLSDKLRGFALERVRTIASSSGYVALQAEFTVSSISGNSRVLVLPHSLNSRLSEGDAKVSIAVVCDEASLLPSGASTFTEKSSVKITCFGKVVRWDESKRCLTINPISIY